MFLTLLGGGVFGNPVPWILDAADRALTGFVDHGLDVHFVSYGSSKAAARSLVDRWER